MSFESAKSLSDTVRHDIVLSSFTPNDDKSVWHPTQKLVFLGTVLDFEEGFILIPERHILKLKSSVVSCLLKDQIVARDLASITGQIISMTCAVGNVARLFTRNCYAAIEHRTSWAQPLNVSAAIRDELSFWLSNIDTINGRVMSPKSSVVGVVYSDTSASGFCNYFVQCGVDLVSGVWFEDQMHSSSTFREILTVKFVLLSLVNQPLGTTVKWFTDNQNVPRIILSGSSKVICSPKLCLFLTSAVILLWHFD